MSHRCNCSASTDWDGHASNALDFVTVHALQNYMRPRIDAAYNSLASAGAGPFCGNASHMAGVRAAAASS